MTAISTWSTTAASNNSASPDGAPEGMAPSGVNNTIREIMAQVRAYYETAEWRDYGHTITYVAATQFKTSGVDTTGTYTVNRRVHANGATTNDVYGIVTASVFSTDTTVTVLWSDGGELQNEALTIEVGPDPTNQPSINSGWEVITAKTDFVTETEIEVTVPAGYDSRIEWYEAAPSVTAEEMVAQVFEGSYITTSVYYTSHYNVLNDGTVSGDAAVQGAFIEMMDPVPATPASVQQASRGYLEIRQPDITSIRSSWSGLSEGEEESSTKANARIFWGHRGGGGSAITKYKIFWSGGATFGSNGSYVVYRRRNGN